MKVNRRLFLGSIYLIHGLDLTAKDFAYPGTYIEKEMIPYIGAALKGHTIYSLMRHGLLKLFLILSVMRSNILEKME